MKTAIPNDLKIVPTARIIGPGSPERWTVHTAKGVYLGLVEKYPNNRTDKHPYKAFAPKPHGTMALCRMLGAFYGKDGWGDALRALIDNGGAR